MFAQKMYYKTSQYLLQAVFPLSFSLYCIQYKNKTFFLFQDHPETKVHVEIQQYVLNRCEQSPTACPTTDPAQQPVVALMVHCDKIVN